MKRIIIVFALLLAGALAAYAMYHYGFILSCGKTVYRSFDYPLSDSDLAQWTDLLESKYCGEAEEIMPGEDPILP